MTRLSRTSTTMVTSTGTSSPELLFLGAGACGQLHGRRTRVFRRVLGENAAESRESEELFQLGNLLDNHHFLLLDALPDLLSGYLLEVPPFHSRFLRQCLACLPNNSSTCLSSQAFNHRTMLSSIVSSRSGAT